MKSCAFLSMDSLEAFECYDHLLFEPFANIGWEVEEVSWRNSSVDWNRFDVVIIRSPWDYQDEPDRFMQVIEMIDASSALLENSLEIVRWNLNKQYLQDMENRGIPIVPTLWKDRVDETDLSSAFEQFDTDALIIKPPVSANADNTFWLRSQSETEPREQALKVFSDRPAMIQPFMKNITSEGEFSLFYFNGDYSHAILKVPGAGDFRVQEEHGGTLHSVEPETALKTISDKTMQALPEIPLYARIDFVRNDQGHYALMELELIEPSLYFNMDPDSPPRFARAFDQRVKNQHHSDSY